MTKCNQGSKNPMYGVSGNLSPRWKGGECFCNGYVLIWKPSHPYSNCRGYIARARLIMEQHLGRYLEPNEIVRHKNGIRDDDRKENLFVESRSKYMALQFYKHGEAGRTRLYTIWASMKRRCYAPTSISHKYYGKKGIKVCDEWRNNYISFRNWALANGYQDNLTIDRKNSDGNYEPSNCQWLTRSENVKKRNLERRKSSRQLYL